MFDGGVAGASPNLLEKWEHVDLVQFDGKNHFKSGNNFLFDVIIKELI